MSPTMMERHGITYDDITVIEVHTEYDEYEAKAIVTGLKWVDDECDYVQMSDSILSSERDNHIVLMAVEKFNLKFICYDWYAYLFKRVRF